jgi:hypothetical protein
MERVAGSGPILLGDLHEEFSAGRSRWWYWREAIHAMAWAIVGAIRHHPIRLVRALLMLAVVNTVAGVALSAFCSSLFHVMPGWIYMRYQVYMLAWISLSLPIIALTTWTMARLHPDVRVPATLVVIAWSLGNVALDGELQRLWANASEPRFVPYLVLRVGAILAWLAALLIGGILAPVPSRQPTATRAIGGRTTP